MLRRDVFTGNQTLKPHACVLADFARWCAAALVLALLHCQTVAAHATTDLSALEIQNVARFAGAQGYRDLPAGERARVAAEVTARYREARALLPGRGPALARHFLLHERPPPSNDAYFFVFEALADPETALILIHALAAPLGEASTADKRSDAGARERVRDNFQIEVAIEAALVDDRVRNDPRVAQALIDTLARLRQQSWDPYYTQMAVGLLGRCSTSAATRALQQLATDGDAGLRRVAIQALGEMRRDLSEKNVAADAGQSSDIAVFMRTLTGDSDVAARAAAATALGDSNGTESITALRAALTRERQPQVIDAIVLALHKRAAPFADAAECRDLIARTWELAAARVLFACWHGGATRAELIDAATHGAPPLRVLSLESLTESPAPRASQVRIAGPLTASRLHPGRAAALQGTAIAVLPGEIAPALDPATQQRLLASAVEVLSLPSASTPVDDAMISAGAIAIVNDALWNIAGHDMPLALKYADRVTPASRRYSSVARYGASYSLWNKDQAAYIDYRRPRQMFSAVIVAAFLSVLLWWKKARRAGALLVIAVLSWALFTGGETDIAALPPPPLQWLSVSAIAFFSAGLSAALASVLSPLPRYGTLAAVVKRGTLTMLGAALLAFVACVASRGRFFPIGSEGWELIFDPVGAALTAALVTIGLLWVDGLILRRLLST